VDFDDFFSKIFIVPYQQLFHLVDLCKSWQKYQNIPDLLDFFLTFFSIFPCIFNVSLNLVDQFVTPFKVFVIQPDFITLFVVSGWNSFLKIWQKIVQKEFFHIELTLFINKNANALPIFLKVCVRYANLFFWLVNCIPIDISSSSFSVSGSSSRFLLNFLVFYNNLRLDDKA
jgi:hypothetical protein